MSQDWFHKYKGEYLWMYAYTITLALAFNFFSTFISRDIFGQAIISIILGGIGAFLGFSLFTFASGKNKIQKLLFLISILLFIFGIWLTFRNHYFPIDLKGTKFV